MYDCRGSKNIVNHFLRDPESFFKGNPKKNDFVGAASDIREKALKYTTGK